MKNFSGELLFGLHTKNKNWDSMASSLFRRREIVREIDGLSVSYASYVLLNIHGVLERKK